LDLDLGVCNIGHPEIAVGVIVSLIAKRGSQTSLKKSALLSSRALFSYHFKQSLQAKWCSRGLTVSDRAEICNILGAVVIE
jgi:hypothetical protein